MLLFTSVKNCGFYFISTLITIVTTYTMITNITLSQLKKFKSQAYISMTALPWNLSASTHTNAYMQNFSHVGQLLKQLLEWDWNHWTGVIHHLWTYRQYNTWFLTHNVHITWFTNIACIVSEIVSNIIDSGSGYDGWWRRWYSNGEPKGRLSIPRCYSLSVLKPVCWV